MSVNDKLETNPELVKALTALWESSAAADGDLSGDQREWHVPRLTKATAIMTKLFPNHSGKALLKAKSPYGDQLV